MKSGVVFFYLVSEERGMYDGSIKGLGITISGKVEPKPDGSVRFDGGFIEISRNADLDKLDSFTIKANVMPDKVVGSEQNIIVGESPAIRLFIDSRGRLAGSINTTNGLEQFDSGSKVIQSGRFNTVCFTRDDNGHTKLEIDGNEVSSKDIPSKLDNTGTGGLKIGDGFYGIITDLVIGNGVLDQNYLNNKAKAADDFIKVLTDPNGQFKFKNVEVEISPDSVYLKLQKIKGIMNAVGVNNLTDLEPFRISKKKVIKPGKVIIASNKPANVVDWSNVASSFQAKPSRDILAAYLLNRNSSKTLSSFNTSPPTSTAGTVSGGPITGTRFLPNIITIRSNSVTIADPNLMSDLQGNKPQDWPSTSSQINPPRTSVTIPQDSAVIIASQIDLTGAKIVIDPDVRTFYIIAEEMICGNNTEITWERPGGNTYPRADNPELNGTSYSGSHNGMSGENGQEGQPGITGANGRNAPDLEIWAKMITSMPNMDLDGEDGIKGGKGQRGGNGGNGANGAPAKKDKKPLWPDSCKRNPGDGGDGGDGRNGGPGGKGGNGGNGGKITIGLLEGTFNAIASSPYKSKNEGGRGGDGGDGGEAGQGGQAGNAGKYDKVCSPANNGTPGRNGQKGDIGLKDDKKGLDEKTTFYEFDLNMWNELMTRPWLTEVSPDSAFPGDPIILRGSRFTDTDLVLIGNTSLNPTIKADESLEVIIPLNMSGGEKAICIKRQDRTESNRQSIWIKPQLDQIKPIIPGEDVTLTGSAFIDKASVLINGSAIPGTVSNQNSIVFHFPSTASIGGNSGYKATMEVRNPDGMLSNSRVVEVLGTLEIPFEFGKHNLFFGNFSDGIPSWDTYKQTFGTTEIWYELIANLGLAVSFYGFYNYFLKGEANGGLATGFCTSMASIVADRFWQGHADTTAIQKKDIHKDLTAIHGKLLSRESLIHFHDQSREGISRVEKTYREIEATFLRGCDRQNAPLLFFIPSGAIWDDGYIDSLGDTHCVMPYRFIYPEGHTGPQLSSDRGTTLTDPNKVKLYVWDCNHPDSPDCYLVFNCNGSRIDFEYFALGNLLFDSKNGRNTLGMMTHGQYMLADHDLPFSGPLGLTQFVFDFLLSPADLQITDPNGNKTGLFGKEILSEIPNSRPCYLIKGAYMLPGNIALNRKIIGTGLGKYTFASLIPDGISLTIKDVSTDTGQEDVLLVNADGTQIRFEPSVKKDFTIAIARCIGDQIRELTIDGIEGDTNNKGVDITTSPDLSIVRIGNRCSKRTVNVRTIAINRNDLHNPLANLTQNIDLPQDNDLVVSVSDWTNLTTMKVQAVPF